MLEQTHWTDQTQRPHLGAAAFAEKQAHTQMQGVRGAVHVGENTAEAILTATHDLLSAICAANPTLAPENIASIFFTATADLDTAFPALAARQLGWASVPLLCAQEIPVPGSLSQVVRILIHWNTPLAQARIQHVYLGKTSILRPDLNK